MDKGKKYSEYEKFKKVKKEFYIFHNFIEWLNDGDMDICSSNGEFIHHHDQLICRYLGINEENLKKEKRKK